MGNRGFTFLEIILVIVLMGVAIPGLISAVSFITKAQVNPVGTSTASYLSQESMEEMIAKKASSCGTCGYANLTVGTGTFAPVTGFSNYEKKTDVAYVDASFNPVGSDQGYKKVTVTVRDIGVGPSIPDAVLETVLTNY
ncbi:MAG: type II secretion system protein [Nitrospiria bacterium]